MDAARWQRLKPWLDRLLDLEPDARGKLLARLPDEAADLHGDLVGLLAQHEVAATIDEGAAALAAPVLAASEMSSQELEGERVGQQIGPYRIKRLLGSGGMGAVYLAEREDSGFVQRVALKVVRITLKRGAARERFDRERRILAELKHPNIAQLFDGGETLDGAPYYTMEYVDGVPISEFCRAHPGDVALCVRLMLKVASALAHAHQRLIIHRDIKPSNILVTGEQHVKLLDFGIAKPVYAPIGASLTRGAVGPMTPEYAAPEQFRGGTVTVATDIYQFGMLLYRLLTGRFPYDADPADTIGWARAVTEQEPIALVRALSLTRRRSRDVSAESVSRPEFDDKHLRRWLSGDLDAIVRMTLAKRPDDRYRSMDALIADLEAFLRGDPVSARRASAGYRARRFVARHKVAVATALLSSIALLGVTVYALREASKAHAEAARASAAIGFVEEMFERLDPAHGGTRELSAEAMLEHATERLDRDEIGQSALRVRLEQLIGNAYIALGDFTRARTRFSNALEALRRDPQRDPLQLAQVLERTAWTYYRGGRVDEAIAMLDEATLLLGRPRAPTVDTEVAIGLFRGVIERDRGRSEAALPHVTRALTLSMEDDGGSGSERTANALWRTASVYKDLNRFDEALETAERAYRWYEQHYGVDDLRTVKADELVGWVLTGTDRLDEAALRLERAGERLRATLGENSARYGSNLYDRGLLYRRRGEHQRAQEAFAQVVRIYRSVYGPNSVELGWATWNQGMSMSALGRSGEALREYEQADAIWSHSMNAVTPVRASLWSDLVASWIVNGQLQRADEAARDYLVRIDAAQLGRSNSALKLYALRAAVAATNGDDASARTLRDSAERLAAQLAANAAERTSYQQRIDQLAATRPAPAGLPEK